MHLFGRIKDGELHPFTYYGLRVYGWKIWDGDTLVHDFVPCYRVFDRQPGLLDKVSGKFHANKGTGAFKYSGRKTRTLPEDYQALDSLVATGAQHIATGVKSALDVTVMAVVRPFTATGDVYQTTTRDYSRSMTYVDGVRQSWTATSAADGAEVTFLQEGDVVAGAGAIRSLYVWRAGELVRDYESCYRVADGVAGLYDLVSGTFQPSETEDPFLHGLGGAVGFPVGLGTVESSGFTSGKLYENLTNVTASLWVRNPNVGDFGWTTTFTYGVLASQGALGGRPGICFYVSQNASGQKMLCVQLRKTEDDITGLAITNSVIHTDGKWHHVAVTLDSGEGVLRLYVDGTVVASRRGTEASTLTVPGYDSSQSFTIGMHRQRDKKRGWHYTYPYRGELAQVSLWDRALSPAQVKRLRARPVTGTEKGLLDAWPLDAGEAGMVGLVSGSPLTMLATSDVGFIPDEVPWCPLGMMLVVR